MPKPDALRARRSAHLARIQPSTVNEERRSVDAVLATESPTVSLDLQTREPFLEVLRMDGVRLPAQIPLLDTHERDTVAKQIGSVRNLRVEGTRLLGTLYVSAAEEATWTKIREGHLTDVSVGQHAEKETIIPRGRSAEVGGKRYTAPPGRALYVNETWRLREASLTVIGADSDAKIRNEDQAMKMNAKTRRVLEVMGLRTDATEEEAKDFLASLAPTERARAEAAGQDPPPADPLAPPPATPPAADPPPAPPASNPTPPAAPPAANPPATPPADPPPADPPRRTTEDLAGRAALAERERIRQAERDRARTIDELAVDGVPEDLRTRAVDEGWTVDRASRQFLTALRDSRAPSVGPGIHTRSHEQDCTVDALAAGLRIRNGGARMIDPNASDARRQEQERLADAGDRFRDLSLFDHCREAVRLDGGHHSYDRHEMIRAAVSGSSLTSIFTTSARSSLMQAYTQYPDSTLGWVAEEDVANFKINEKIAMAKQAALTKHARGGTADHANRSDSKEEYKIARYSKKFVVDEMDIRDDDHGALKDQPTEFGEAAARLRPDLIYALLLANAALADTGALFNATAVTTTGGHANLTTAVLGFAGIEAAMDAVGIQTDNGVNLDLTPRFLVVPHALRWTAKEILKSSLVVYGADDETIRGNMNVLADVDMKIVVDNRIGAAGVTDPNTGTPYTGSATNWFLSTGPRRTLIVGYLAGSGRRPTIESYRLGEGQWGIGWAVKHDLGVKALDFRGLHRSAGTG